MEPTPEKRAYVSSFGPLSAVVYMYVSPVSACCHENNTATRRITLVQTAIEYQKGISVQHMFPFSLSCMYDTYEYVCIIQSKKKGLSPRHSLIRTD